MKIKVYVKDGYRIITLSLQDSIKNISDIFDRWEYVL